MAVVSAIFGSVGTLTLIEKLKFTGTTKLVLNKISPFAGVVLANEVNLYFSRI